METTDLQNSFEWGLEKYQALVKTKLLYLQSSIICAVDNENALKELKLQLEAVSKDVHKIVKITTELIKRHIESKEQDSKISGEICKNITVDLYNLADNCADSEDDSKDDDMLTTCILAGSMGGIIEKRFEFLEEKDD